MNISVFGMGYVGIVSAACFAEQGNKVIGVDVSKDKIDEINDGQTPICEAGLSDIIAKHRGHGITATSDYKAAIKDTDISFVCVGTPSRSDGSITLDFVKTVCEQIGQAIKEKQGKHTVVIRSTIIPGTMETIIKPILERESGRTVGDNLGLCNNPEFLREGSAIYDFYNPPKTVVGVFDNSTVSVLEELYGFLDDELILVKPKVAELIKYLDNPWHALKVAFANEIGRICKDIDIDSHDVMDVFCADKKLNISTTYLKPGFAFGGSCLPKDLRAITRFTKDYGIHTPLLNSILESNKEHISIVVDSILSQKVKNIGILGLSFKAGTDDLRESPMVKVVEILIEHDLNIVIYDETLNPSKLMGANLKYISKKIQNMASMLVETHQQFLDNSELIVVGNPSEIFKTVLSKTKPTQKVFDLVRLIKPSECPAEYEGLSW